MFVSQPDHVTCPHAQSQNNNAIAETLPDMHAGSLIIMMLIITLTWKDCRHSSTTFMKKEQNELAKRLISRKLHEKN